MNRSRLFAISSFAILLSVSLTFALFPSTAAQVVETIPEVVTEIDLDAFCDLNAEYGKAAVYTYADVNQRTSTIYVQHDGSSLFICAEGGINQFAERYFGVYLDTNFGQEKLAQRDDLQLSAYVENSATAGARGDGAGGYTRDAIPAWDAVAGVQPNLEKEFAEYQISLELLRLQCADDLFGLAVYHHDVQSAGDLYGWPSNTFFNSPATWVSAALAGLPSCQPTNTPTASHTPTHTPTATATTTPSPTPTNTPVPSLGSLVAIPYLPPKLIAYPILANDLSIYGIELTQGIQCFDTSQGLAGCPDNSLPLVNKKDATARIYLRLSGISSQVNNIPVRLHIFANGVEYIANVSGNATKTLDQGAADSADVYFNVNFTNDISVSFYAVVDPDNTILETNEGNNRFPASGTITRTFRRRDNLKIVGQRLRYHPSGYSGSQYAGGWAVNGGAADYFEQLLPIRNNGIDYTIASGYLDWTQSLTPCGSGVGPDNQHDLIKTLNAQWILQNVLSFWFSGSFSNADHVYGWVPDDGYPCGHADMPVYPHAGGLGVVGIGTDAPGTNTDDPGAGSFIFVHELLHDYDLKHTDTGADDCGSNDSSSAFPYSTSSIQEYGFNPITSKIYDPANTHDVMSYCPAGGSTEGWISPYTWSYMSSQLDADVKPRLNQGRYYRLGTENMVTTAAGQSLVVNARIYNPAHPDYNAGLFHSLSNLNLIDGGIEYLLPGTGYAIDLVDDGSVVYTENFGVSFVSEYHAEAHTGGTGADDPVFPPTENLKSDVTLVIPWTPGTTEIVLRQGDAVLATQPVSNNAPAVTITQPAAAASWPAGSQQVLGWTGSDLDGNDLTYTVLYSQDDVNWELIATELTTTSYVIDVDAFAGGNNGRFRVVATDGVKTGFDESPLITIPNKKPIATITNPLDQEVFGLGHLVVLQGTALDFEDGSFADEALFWSSDRDGALGAGPSLPLNGLSKGVHQITLSVTDSDGLQAEDTVEILIGERAYLPHVTR